jgi:hypothetical protein
VVVPAVHCGDLLLVCCPQIVGFDDLLLVLVPCFLFVVTCLRAVLCCAVLCSRRKVVGARRGRADASATVDLESWPLRKILAHVSLVEKKDLECSKEEAAAAGKGAAAAQPLPLAISETPSGPSMAPQVQVRS